MALKVKAKEKLQKIGKYADSYRYVMMPELYSTLTQDKVIKAWATEGHSVALPGLGTMRFGLRAKSCENVNEVKTSVRVIMPRSLVIVTLPVSRKTVLVSMPVLNI